MATHKAVRVEVFTAVTMKNGVFGVLRRVALLGTDVSEELRTLKLKASSTHMKDDDHRLSAGHAPVTQTTRLHGRDD
jgi:hypothetical protein